MSFGKCYTCARQRPSPQILVSRYTRDISCCLSPYPFGYHIAILYYTCACRPPSSQILASRYARDTSCYLSPYPFGYHLVRNILLLTGRILEDNLTRARQITSREKLGYMTL